jgi:hypothetical protein
MATTLSKIKRALRNGDYQIGEHFLDELASDNLTIGEAISSILNAVEFDKLTDDESHTRYRIYGMSASGRNIVTIVFFSQGTLFLKTVYEPGF